MGRTFQCLSSVRGGSDEEDDVHGMVDDVHGAVDDVHGVVDDVGLVVKCKKREMAMKRSLVIRSVMGR